MQTVLVTGINGFVGRHVARQLHDRGVSIIGIGTDDSLAGELEDLGITYVACDLTSPEEVAQLDLSTISAIINLAGIANVSRSAGQSDVYNRVNVGVHQILYEECLRRHISPRIVAVSTGAVYDSNQAMPLTEESALVQDDNTNEYVISKKKAEQVVLELNQRGLRCLIARPFNHTGPGQQPGFLLPDLYDQVIESLKTRQPLSVGNLKTKRDFTDVRDVAKAYTELALCDQSRLTSDVYNICSGTSISGEELLHILATECELNNVQLEVDPRRLRKNEVMDIYGSAARLQAATGWQPVIPIQTTIRDFVKNKRVS